MRAVLFYPPTTDPTAPYHSLAYLSSYIRSHGFSDVLVRDLNAEVYHYFTSKAVLQQLQMKWWNRVASLCIKTALTRLEQLEYRYLMQGIALDSGAVDRAAAVLRSSVDFYDVQHYSRAVETIQGLLRALSCEGIPGQFTDSFSLAENIFSLSNVSDLTNCELLERLANPFSMFLNPTIEQIAAEPYDLFGIGVTYTSQLPYALWLVRRLRALKPNGFIVLGGTEISDCWKYSVPQDVFYNIFDGADACVIGEGEEALLALCKLCNDENVSMPIPNTVFLAAGRQQKVSITYIDLRKLPTPDYSMLNSEAYLSPETISYYSPTRGCYWNRCTFCDYGLNFGTPTAPWRQRPLPTVIDDLRSIARNARFVYLSVDVLAPGALVRLAQALVLANIELKWAAEIRLERYFTAERCKLLAKSGCIAVSVGFESGSQRILDRIDKGIDISAVKETICNLHTAGIAVQLMGFTGFPSEGPADITSTLQFLQETQPFWSVAGIGRFTLTPGAIVARDPKKFNLHQIRHPRGQEVCRSLDFEPNPSLDPQLRSVRQVIDNLCGRGFFDRPFAGGIDSFHSILFYDRYGPEEARKIFRMRRNQGTIGHVISHSPFDISTLCNERDVNQRVNGMDGERLSYCALVKELSNDEGLAYRAARRNPVFVQLNGHLLPLAIRALRTLQGLP
jgi:hypothetical protein